MKRSLNEIEQTSRKAARGSGLPWGVADEVGRAVSWLHIYGIDGVSGLVQLFSRLDHATPTKWSPVDLESPWKSPGGLMSPIHVGLAACDTWNDSGDYAVTTGPVAFPVLVAGLLSLRLVNCDARVCLRWPGVELTVSSKGLGHDGPASELHAQECNAMEVIRGGTQKVYPPTLGDAAVDSRAWAELEALAHRTYVEATEENRLSGAGAGLHDND